MRRGSQPEDSRRGSQPARLEAHNLGDRGRLRNLLENQHVRVRDRPGGADDGDDAVVGPGHVVALLRHLDVRARELHELLDDAPALPDQPAHRHVGHAQAHRHLAALLAETREAAVLLVAALSPVVVLRLVHLLLHGVPAAHHHALGHHRHRPPTHPAAHLPHHAAAAAAAVVRGGHVLVDRAVALVHGHDHLLNGEHDVGRRALDGHGALVAPGGHAVHALDHDLAVGLGAHRLDAVAALADHQAGRGGRERDRERALLLLASAGRGLSGPVGVRLLHDLLDHHARRGHDGLDGAREEHHAVLGAGEGVRGAGHLDAHPGGLLDAVDSGATLPDHRAGRLVGDKDLEGRPGGIEGLPLVRVPHATLMAALAVTTCDSVREGRMQGQGGHGGNWNPVPARAGGQEGKEGRGARERAARKGRKRGAGREGG
mmetsp:Transcript_47522/g.113123  ORF Transcript_47522/g.113123 Transcript_47522/m.113123 type:complete len:430 (-) Transcript_47522:149-1438(-)